MRIVGGQLRGRRLATPSGDAIRPTTDRTREALFNILFSLGDPPLEGARVLDLFAGTGAIGFEALSRGAASALFVELGTEGRGLLRTNIEAFGLTGRTKIFRRDATKLGSVGTMAPFDLLFADPPYRKGLGEAALVAAAGGGWLKPDALAIVEEAADAAFAVPPAFVLESERRFGDTILRFLRHRPST